MSEEMNNVTEYDEDKSIEFIRELLPAAIRDNISDDEIGYVVDLVYDFYEDEGLFEEDDESEIIIDEEKMIDYVIKAARKDKIRDFSDEEIKSIVMGELAYCDSLDLFD